MKSYKRDRRCPVKGCGGIAQMTAHSNSHGTSWMCSECGHRFSEAQMSLEGF